MSNKSRNLTRNIIALSVSAVIIALSLWAVLNRQFVLDSYANMAYQPSAAVVGISERTQLTDEGMFTFYATYPEVLNQDVFNQKCPRQEVGSPILGCYTSEDRIYMYNVTNESLDGMKEVTAVHEVLHAVWARMDSTEKSEIEQLLRTAYDAKADDALKTRMEYYERTEPGEFVNELHAIIGTEVGELDPQLESYYGQFFNRQTVLALHAQYSSVYTELSNRSTELYELMTQLGQTIDSTTQAYNQAATAYSSDVDSFNARANNGSFASRAQFNAERSALVARSGALEAQRQAINQNIETYDGYYTEYQSIGEQLQTLNEGMDSYHKIEETPSV
jgi:uncharacterized protein YukE